MQRQILLAALDGYRKTIVPFFTRCPKIPPLREDTVVSRFHAFVSGHRDCFERANVFGHCTGSALVLNSQRTHVALTLHKKLGFWMQLGGHADGHPLLHEVALREAYEESGLRKLTFLNFLERTQTLAGPLPFDLDIHEIPASGGQASHLHFDARYLILASNEELVRSEESLDLAWFSLEEAQHMCCETSMAIMLAKLSFLCKELQ